MASMALMHEKFLNHLKTTLAKQYFQQLKLDINCFADPNSVIFLENVDVFEIDNRMKNDALLLQVSLIIASRQNRVFNYKSDTKNII